MNNKLDYFLLNIKLKKFSKNIESIASNINDFERICGTSLLLNGEASYKNNIVNLKNDIDYHKKRIDKEILVEIEQKI